MLVGSSKKRRIPVWGILIAAGVIIIAASSFSDALSRPFRYYTDDNYTAFTYYTQGTDGNGTLSLWGINTDNPRCELDINGTVCVNRSGFYYNGVNLTPGGASLATAFVTIGNDVLLTNERAITSGLGISVIDSGANSNVRINITGLENCVNNNASQYNGSEWNCIEVGTGAGTGDIEGVTAGTGLTGGGTSGTVTLNANTTYLQRRVNETCTGGESIRGIYENGSVDCETDSVGSDTNNYPVSISVTGTTTKNVSIERSGLSNISTAFTDIDTDTFNTTADMIRGANTTGYLINWSQYDADNYSTSATVTGTGTKTFNLAQKTGANVTASWTDIDTDTWNTTSDIIRAYNWTNDIDTSAQCSGTDQVTNVTLTNGVVTVTCSAQGSGGGMSSWVVSNGSTTETVTDSEQVTFYGGTNVTINQTANGLTINHLDTSTQASSDNSGRTYVQDVLVDGNGHVIGLTTAAETVVDTDTTNNVTAIGVYGSTTKILQVNQTGGVTSLNFTYTDEVGSDNDNYTVSASVIGTASKTLHLDQLTGSNITASWTDIDTWNTTTEMIQAVNQSGYLVVETDTWNTTAQMIQAVNLSGYLVIEQDNYTVSASVIGTTTKTLNLDQLTGNNISASWTDLDTDTWNTTAEMQTACYVSATYTNITNLQAGNASAHTRIDTLNTTMQYLVTNNQSSIKTTYNDSGVRVNGSGDARTFTLGTVPCANITGADPDFCNDATGSGTFTYSDYFNQVLNTTSNVTFNNMSITTLNAANCDVKANSSGGLYCGTDATGGGGAGGINQTNATGWLNMSNYTVYNVKNLVYAGRPFNITNNGTPYWNLSNGPSQEITLNQSTTFSAILAPIDTGATINGTAKFTLKLRQDGTGSRTATWTPSMWWVQGAEPVLTTTPNRVDIISCEWDGWELWCSASFNFGSA